MEPTRFSRLTLVLILAVFTFGLAVCSDDGGVGPGGDEGTTGVEWVWLNPQPQGNSLLDVDMLDADAAVAVGQGGTILRTLDGGDTWSVVRCGSGYPALNCVSMYGSFGLAVGNAGTALRTRDGGVTWQPVDIGDVRHVRGVEAPMTNIAVVVGDGGLIRRTADGGSTWDTQDTGVDNLYAVSFFNAGRGVAVGSRASTLLTDDAGASWQPRSLPSLDVNLRSVAMTAGFAAIAVGGFTDWNDSPPISDGYVCTTGDGGSSWTLQRLTTSSILHGLTMATSSNGFALGDNSLFETSDGGQHWSQLQPPSRPLTAISSAGAGVIAGVGSAGVILRSEDSGSSWASQTQSRLPESPSSAACRTVWFTSPDNGFVGLEWGGLYQTFDGGESWVRRITDASVTDLYFHDASTGLALIGNKVSRTDDGGMTWKVAAGGDGILGFHFADSEVGLGTGNSGLTRRTTDGGLTWTGVVAPAGYALQAPYLVDRDTVLVIGQSSTIFRSTNGGVTSWERIDVPHQAGAIDFNADRSIGIAVGYGGISRTTDAGATWEDRGTVSGYFYAVTFVDAVTACAAGSDGGVLMTTDGGLTWSRQETPCTNDLYDVFFTGPAHGVAVGSGGTILKTTTVVDSP
jgi:photosystem II stability/assembly factor-like uncharacterized protein